MKRLLFELALHVAFQLLIREVELWHGVLPLDLCRWLDVPGLRSLSNGGPPLDDLPHLELRLHKIDLACERLSLLVVVATAQIFVQLSVEVIRQGAFPTQLRPV